MSARYFLDQDGDGRGTPGLAGSELACHVRGHATLESKLQMRLLEPGVASFARKRERPRLGNWPGPFCVPGKAAALPPGAQPENDAPLVRTRRIKGSHRTQRDPARELGGLLVEPPPRPQATGGPERGWTSCTGDPGDHCALEKAQGRRQSIQQGIKACPGAGSAEATWIPAGGLIPALLSAVGEAL